MDLFEDLERLKLRFLAAFEGLRRQGVISESQLTEVIEIVDKLDDMSEEEIRAKLSPFLENNEADTG